MSRAKFNELYAPFVLRLWDEVEDKTVQPPGSKDEKLVGKVFSLLVQVHLLHTAWRASCAWR